MIRGVLFACDWFLTMYTDVRFFGLWWIVQWTHMCYHFYRKWNWVTKGLAPKSDDKTRMHSSRMRTGRTLTVFRKLETPPKIWSRHPPRKFEADTPPENLEQAPPKKNLEQTPPPKIGADTPPKFGAGTPPPCGQNDTRFWKYYLGQNFVSAGNKTKSIQNEEGIPVVTRASRLPTVRVFGGHHWMSIVRASSEQDWAGLQWLPQDVTGRDGRVCLRGRICPNGVWRAGAMVCPGGDGRVEG